MRNLITAVFISLFFSSFVSATEMQHHQHTSQETAVYHSKGTVKAWGEQKVSLAHPAIPALNWPPMTMNFLQPQPPLPALAAGTVVEFSFRQVDGGYQLTAIRTSQD